MREGVSRHGLDYRHPLLDFELVDLALRLPPELSFEPAFNRPVMRRSDRGLLRRRCGRDHEDELRAACAACAAEGPTDDQGVLAAPDAEINRYADHGRL